MARLHRHAVRLVRADNCHRRTLPAISWAGRVHLPLPDAGRAGRAPASRCRLDRRPIRRTAARGQGATVTPSPLATNPTIHVPLLPTAAPDLDAWRLGSQRRPPLGPPPERRQPCRRVRRERRRAPPPRLRAARTRRPLALSDTVMAPADRTVTRSPSRHLLIKSKNDPFYQSRHWPGVLISSWLLPHGGAARW